MVVRQRSRRRTPGWWGLFAPILAGVALATSLTIDRPDAARQLGAVVPVAAPAPTSGSGGVTFEVLPVQPTATPTGRPTPRPTGTGGGHLPVTGDEPMPSGWLFVVGAVLLLIGALTVAVSRGLRRRRS
ncbi:hypothetical protein OG792_34575 [Micromonospora sp. NBC_01699]|uniref:hypothetical protein n=1 Tax=Micromonospora sp. NBC_01699 TaxID=2975984 RepID=UPI002E2960E6|nr:hypothetical protein [Micromonospora sp. NBC_01699]